MAPTYGLREGEYCTGADVTEISPEAQTLIDRIKRMDPANPRHDTATIECAITAHLKALGLPRAVSSGSSMPGRGSDS